MKNTTSTNEEFIQIPKNVLKEIQRIMYCFEERMDLRIEEPYDEDDIENLNQLQEIFTIYLK